MVTEWPSHLSTGLVSHAFYIIFEGGPGFGSRGDWIRPLREVAGCDALAVLDSTFPSPRAL